MSAPAQVSLKQIIRAHLKMATRRIDAAQHYLIIQDQLADEFWALNLQRMITAGNACDHINPNQGQSIEQIELQRRKSTGIDDQVHWTNLLLDLVGRHLAFIHIMSTNHIEPLRACACTIDHVQSVNVGSSKSQHHAGQQTYGTQSCDQATASDNPCRSDGSLGGTHSLQAQRFFNTFLDDGKRFHQHANRFQFGRHGHNVLFLINYKFCLITIQSADALLFVVASLAHICTSHQAGRALAGSSSDGEDGEISHVYARDRWRNNGYVAELNGRTILMAQKEGTWLALAATVPFARVSCGYVGRSDGWTDLACNFQMDWEFDHATDGNIALIGQLDLRAHHEFTLGLAFGDTRRAHFRHLAEHLVANDQHHAITTLFQALGTPFEEHHKRYREQWDRTSAHQMPLEKVSSDNGNLYHSSFSLMLAHEDKSYPGALIASLSIPWGEAAGDKDQGGYHLVWTRDMVNSASALLASGESATPLRALIYLAVCQQEDGGFAQNFWVNGNPYWRGIQLDEVAFPILLALRLSQQNALQEFDPYPMVLKAASYLLRHGPVTQTGTMGGSQRLFSVHFGFQYRSPYWRGLLLQAASG